MAVGAGVGLGLLLGSVPALRAATGSTIEFLRPIPSVALIPLAVLLFGTDLRSKLLLVVYAAFWQVLIQVLHGVQDVDPVAMDTAHSYGLGRWARVAGPPPDLAVVFQEYGRSLFPWMTVRGNVELPLRSKRLPRDRRDELVTGALAAVGLGDVHGAYPWQLSAGCSSGWPSPAPSPPSPTSC